MSYPISKNIAPRVSHRLLCNHPNRTAAIHPRVIRILRILDHADTGVLRFVLRKIPYERDPVMFARIPVTSHKHLRRSGLAGSRC